MGWQEFGKLPGKISDFQTVSFSQVRSGTITAQEVVLAGGTNGIIRSQNYDGSSTGWAIFGDGSASFYGDITIGADAIILGDLYSSNWNGTIPANLATRDTGATAGYYLDSSVGAAQFEGSVFIDGALEVRGATDLYSTLSVETGGSITVDGTSGQKTVLTYIGGLGGVQFHGATGEDQYGYIYAINSEELQVAAPIGNDTSYSGGIMRIQSANALGFIAGFIFGEYGAANNNWVYINSSGIRNAVGGSASSPAFSWQTDTNTGIYRRSADNLAIGTGGAERWYISSAGQYQTVDMEIVHSGGPQIRLHDVSNVWYDLESGQVGSYFSLSSNVATVMLVHPSNGQILTNGSTRPQFTRYNGNTTGLGLPNNGYWELWANNAVNAYGGANDIAFPGAGSTTNSGLPAWRQNSSSGSTLLRLTSSRKFKKDIRDLTPKEIDDILRELDGLRPRMYKSKHQADDSRKNILGVVAEEAYEVAPDLTDKPDEEGNVAGFYYDGLNPRFLVAIKDLRERVAALEEKVAALS